MKPSISNSLFTEIRESTTIRVIFDSDLNFEVISKGAEKEWGLTQQEVEHKPLTAIFPDIIASTNHRNILKSLTGQEFSDVIESRSGKIMKILYQPLLHGELITGLHIDAQPVAAKTEINKLPLDSQGYF